MALAVWPVRLTWQGSEFFILMISHFEFICQQEDGDKHKDCAPLIIYHEKLVLYRHSGLRKGNRLGLALTSPPLCLLFRKVAQWYKRDTWLFKHFRCKSSNPTQRLAPVQFPVRGNMSQQVLFFPVNLKYNDWGQLQLISCSLGAFLVPGYYQRWSALPHMWSPPSSEREYSAEGLKIAFKMSLLLLCAPTLWCIFTPHSAMSESSKPSLGRQMQAWLVILAIKAATSHLAFCAGRRNNRAISLLWLHHSSQPGYAGLGFDFPRDQQTLQFSRI